MGKNHREKVKEADKELEELFNSGITVGHQINCNGTSTQTFWRRDLLFLRYFCIERKQKFETAEAKETHMQSHESHRGNKCSQCGQVVPRKGEHVNTVFDGYNFYIGGARKDI